MLAVAKHSAVNIEVHVTFEISVLGFFGLYPEVELLGQKRILLLLVGRSSQQFSAVVAALCRPTNVVQGIPVLYVLAKNCCLLLSC